MSKKKDEPDVSGFEIVVRDQGASTALTKETSEPWLKDQLAADTKELYFTLKTAMKQHMESVLDENGKVVKLPTVKIMELAARMLSLDAGANGPLVQFNSFNQTNNVQAKTTLEDLIRRSESRKNDPNIIDAEIVE